MPLLEIVTRTCKRPGLLKNNQASVAALIGNDWLHTLLIDATGRGIGWSYDNLAGYAPNLVGDYIWLLDDDDRCIYPNLVSELRSLVDGCAPDVVIVRMDHGPLGILPDEGWAGFPQQGDIGCSAMIVRRDWWQTHAGALTPGHYSSDYDFFRSLMISGPRVVWWDIVASAVQRISRGEPEYA